MKIQDLLENLKINEDILHNEAHTDELQCDRVCDKTKLQIIRTKFCHINRDINFADLVELKIRENKIDGLLANAFQGMINLKVLDLIQNQIGFIEKDSFHGLDKLETLLLSINKIKHIEEATFDCLPNLIDLNLNFNELTTVSSFQMGKLPKLRLLNLALNKITCIQTRFGTFLKKKKKNKKIIF